MADSPGENGGPDQDQLAGQGERDDMAVLQKVAIHRDTYRRVLSYAGQLQAQRKKRVTLTDAINALLDNKQAADKPEAAK